MISKYFFVRNCLFKSTSTTLFIVNTFAFLMNRIIKKIQFWRSRFFKRCIFCVRTIFFRFFSNVDIFFFVFENWFWKKKFFAFMRFVNFRLLKRKKRWQKKNDFFQIDELLIIVSFIKKSLTNIVKLIICECVVQIVIESDYRKIKNRSICKIFYKIFKYTVKRNKNICVWKSHQ